jgi:cation-transporting ATPase 13A1
MITGDNPLTACHVAKELHFTRKPLLVLTAPSNGTLHNKTNSSFLNQLIVFNLEAEEWKWETVHKDICLPIQPPNIRDFTRQYDLCITGEVKNIYQIFLREKTRSSLI